MGDEDRDGIDEAEATRSAVVGTHADERPPLAADPREPEYEDERSLLPGPDEAWRAAKITSALIVLVWLVAFPIGTMLAARENTGVWNFGLGYSGSMVILALSNAGIVLVGGYLLRGALRLEATADRLGAAMRRIEPTLKADNLRTEMDVLGTEVDRALGKLAKAEKQIRDQVGAIDAATEAMRQGSHQTTERLAKERQGLIDATAAMNREAEAFAQAIAERTETAHRGLETPQDIEDKVARLEAVSRDSAEQFASLREAMAENTALLKENPGAMKAELEGSAENLRRAQSELLAESEKLRSLITQQQVRANQLGQSLAAQSKKLSERQDTARSLGGSWRRILDKVERQVTGEGPEHAAEPSPPQRPEPVRQDQPQPTQHAPRPLPADDMPEERARLERLQRFTVTMKSRLFGAPSKDEARRFEGGERSIFTQEILSHDQISLRARLRAAIDEDDGFGEEAETFLAEFDQLLAPIMTEDPEGAEAALQDMLRSPLGQLYVLIGTAKGHFV